MKITVAARQSPLSQAQTQEVLIAIRKYHPEVDFDPYLLESQGDKDQKTSLRSLGKTDFFTKEIDECLLAGKARLAIHSAKDLPEPLPEGLSVVALTHGVDPSDSLVVRDGNTLSTLPPNPLIATSSVRREEAVRALCPNATFCDIRGTIAKRLEKLFNNEVDGVVIAEAALIRLKMTHLNRVTIPGEVAAYQGQLAIMARRDDDEMRRLFEPLDCRKNELYIGLEAPLENLEVRREHIPFIETTPLPRSNADIQHFFDTLSACTHLLFTSKTAVRLFFARCRRLREIPIVVVGKATGRAVEAEGFKPAFIAETEQAEGVVDMLDQQDLSQAHIFWPHSALARPVLPRFFEQKKVKFTACALYTTIARRPDPLPNLEEYESIFFTSPSTVDAFISFYGELPVNKTLRSQGAVTKNYMDILKQSEKSDFRLSQSPGI